MFTKTQQKTAEDILEYSKNGEYWCISEETGQLIYDLIVENNCKYAVECGSGIGYSTLWIATAIKKNKGRMIGYEFFRPKWEKTGEFMKQARLGTTVELICTSAHKGIPHLKRGVDFAFLDARKCDYLEHFQLLEKKMVKNAIVVADNVTSHAKKLTEYLKYVRNKYPSDFVDIGTGVEVTYLSSKR